MKNKIDRIENIIIKIIKFNKGIDIDDKEKNLFSPDYDITSAEMLYIIDDLEKELNIDVCKIFEQEGYESFNVSSFAKNIYKLMR